MAKSFELAGLEMPDKKPAEVTKKYPELYAWRGTALKSWDMLKAKQPAASGKKKAKKKSGK